MSTLDDILRPMKWVDREVVHRAYNRVASYIEDKGIDRNTVARGLAFLPHASLLAVHVSVGDSLPHPSSADPAESASALAAGLFWAANYCIDLAHTLKGGGEDKVTDGEMSLDKFDSAYTTVQKACRLPLLTFAAYSFYEAVHTTTQPENAVCAAGLGIVLASTASSMYMKDTDTGALDKSPLWERAYNWISRHTKNPAPRSVSAKPY